MFRVQDEPAMQKTFLNTDTVQLCMMPGSLAAEIYEMRKTTIEVEGREKE